jgi:macrolide transport system ATP-binding/permease protein
MFARLHSIWRSLRHRSRFEGELDDEMRFHLEARAEDLMRAGMSREEARRRARLEFGAVDKAKEETQEARGVSLVDSLAQDLRFGMRLFVKNPGFSATAVITLSFGICASVAIFAFVDAAMIKALPYRDASQLAAVYERYTMIPHSNLSYLDYLDWKRLNRSFSAFDVWNETGYLLSTPGGGEPVSAMRVTAGFFGTLGISPVVGRDFAPGEDQPSSPDYALISYAAWQKRYGGEKNVIGKSVILSGVPYQIIGVLPREFQFAPSGGAEIWTSLKGNTSCEKRRTCHNLYGVARLEDGVTLAGAQADTSAIASQLEIQYPDSNRGQGAAIVPLREALTGKVQPVLILLLTGAALLLLIACINVAGLLLSRSVNRRREFAVRTALGASSARLARQFMAEGLILVGASVALGLLAAVWTIGMLVALIPKDMVSAMPYLSGLGMNPRVLAFAAAISGMAAAVFAVVPLARVLRPDLANGLAEGSRSVSAPTWRRFGSNFVVVELALAMVLLVGAGLLSKSLYRLLRVDLNFEPDHLATLEVVASDAQYPTNAAAAALIRAIEQHVSNLPGVESAGITTDLVLNGNGNTTWFRIMGRAFHGEHNDANERDVSPDYFKTLRAKMLRGRAFTANDTAGKTPVCIINQTLMRKYFGDEDPVGKVIGDNTLTAGSIRQIVGVVDDIHEATLDDTTWPAIYIPIDQDPDTYVAVVARTMQEPGSILPTLDTAIHEIAPDLGTIGEMTMETKINNSPSTYMRRSSAELAGGFAGVALLLGVVGLYGVIAYSVSQRTREIGIRMALGAQRGSVYRLILKEASWLAAVGVVLGAACSSAATDLMKSMLFGTSAWDLSTFAGVVAVLATASLLASYLPARRATRVDPMEALRHE